MAIPRLDIHSTRAQLQITRQPMRLTVERTSPRMKVHRTRPKFKIANSKQLLGEQVGRRPPNAQRQEMMRRAQMAMMHGISKVNAQADAMANYQAYGSGGPSVVAQVQLNSILNQPTNIIDVANVPQSQPEVEWDTGAMEIEWDMGDLEMNWEGGGRPSIEVTPHSVEIRLISGEIIRVGEQEAKSIEKQGYGKRIDKEV